MAVVFPHLAHLEIERVSASGPVLFIEARTAGHPAACCDCGVLSQRVHGRYERRLSDTAVAGREVLIRLRVSRLFCDNIGCRRRTFAEQVPELAGRHARRTMLLRRTLCAVGLALGGRAGARLAAQLAASVSRMTLLRQVRALPDPQLVTPRVLGVDDFALRRGHHYGTILIDIESHCPIEVLPDRSADTLAGWLRAHPGVEIICRDRAGAYAEGAAAGAPEAIQIADRWHIWNNLGDAVERTVARNRTALTAAIGGPETTEGPDSADTAEGPAAMQLVPVAPEQRLDRTAIRTRQRFTEVQQLLSRASASAGSGSGWAWRAALSAASPAPNRRKNCWSTTAPATGSAFSPTTSPTCTSAGTTAPPTRRSYFRRSPLAYRGSEKTVRNYLRAFRGRTRAVEPHRKPPAVRRVTGWIMTNPANLDLDDQHDLDAILAASPELAELTAHIRVRRDHGPTPRSRPPPVDGKR